MGPIETIKVLWAGNKLKGAVEKAEWRKGMGWRTITGAVLLGLGTTLRTLDELGVLQGGAAIAEGLMGLGTALGLYGLRSAIAKNGGAK